MLLNYEIEEKKVLIFSDHSKLLFKGWAIDKSGHIPSFVVIVNGKNYYPIVTYVERKDILTKLKLKSDCSSKNPSSCGFIISCDVEKNLVDVTLLAKWNSEEMEICFLSEQETIEMSIDGSFLTKIENCSVERNSNVCSVSGWILSKSDYSIKVYDDQKILCESSFRKVNRYDLNKIGLVSNQQKLCGYILCFVVGTGHNYTIVFENERGAEIRKSIFIKQEESKLSALKSYVKYANFETIKKGFCFLKNYGIANFLLRLKKGYVPHIEYNVWFRDNRITEYEMEKQKSVHFSYEPKISIAVPTFNTPVDMLRIMIDSVLDQTYSNWELCIADASDADNPAREVIREYEKRDNKIKVIYLSENYGIAGNTNKAFELATGEYTGLLDHDDFLEPDALFEVVKLLNEYPYDCLYTDEDKFNTDKNEFIEPNFKPDFAIDALRSHNYITHFFVAKTELINSLGGERNEYNGSQDYDLIFRCVEKANKVGHIAKCLYHWRIYEGSTAGNPEQKMYCYEAGKKAIEGNLERSGIKGTVEMMKPPFWGLYHVKYETTDNPLVSIIIPNYENRDVLKRCIDSLFTVNTWLECQK